ncbi:hypothetical protein CXB51_015873 [Gossypium anomalum]|uniref:Uncharacterized protein n=1 Tax=Gossypium anomalum TaxID=47600 RepID=A0A8J6D1S7_9ROSI|nr:hypothetical protein CXB51_015873 [Gossypium anomalum]
MKTKEDNLPAVLSVVKDGSFVQIKVLFFAKARDIVGLTELSMEVSSGSTTQDCLNKLVKDKDELAIIPPISGGTPGFEVSRVMRIV